MRHLEDRTERQTLVLRALFSLLNEKVPISEQELLRRVRKLAPAGGVYSRGTKSAQPCENCGSSMGRRRNRCLFCGGEREMVSAFEFLEVEPETGKAGPDATGTPKKPSNENIRPARRGGG